MRHLAVALLLAAATVAWRPAGAIDIQRVVSPGGIEAWLVEDHKNPIVTLYADFRGGEATDPPGKEGRATFVSGMLDEGAGTMDSQTFRQAKESRSIRLSFRSGKDSFGASLTTLTEHADEAFRLLRLALTEPRFDPEPLARVRAQIETSIRARRERPQAIASRVWWQAMFPDHPYGRPSDGTLDSVAALGPEDLRAFVGAVLARDRLSIGVVGDIAPDRLAVLLDEVFGALPAVGTAPVVAGTAPAAIGETMVVARDVPQTVVTFGHAGIKREDPDWYAASILMEIIGGGFGSRLTEEIREKRGLTYGVYAYALPLDHAGLVAGGVSTRNDKAAESIRLVRDVWGRLGEDGPTEREVADAKTYINGSFPLRFTDSSSIARTLAGVQREGLGIDYLDRRAGIIEAVTMADLQRVAKRLFRAKDLTFAIVGMPDGIEPTVEAPDPNS